MQVKVRTPAGPQHVDFVLTAANALRVGLEISELEDEQERHGREIKYAWRDALVIGSARLDVLYRFRAEDLLHRPHDVLYLASQWDPVLFTTCGQINLHTLAEPLTRLLNPQPYQAKITMNYPGAEPDGEQAPGLTSISVKRLARANPDAWMRLYDQALAHYSTPAK